MTPTPKKPATPRRRLYARLAVVVPTLIVTACVALSVFSSHSGVPSAHAAGTALAPSERNRKVARLVGEVIERQHYRQTVLDDKMSSEVYDHYLQSLDNSRSYFLASDIAEFEPYRHKMGEVIRTGKLEPIFEIFARYQLRNRQAVAAMLANLANPPDFDIDETLSFDREKAPWLASQDAWDDLWRKRVKNDALSLMLAKKTWAEARDVLQKRYERVQKRIDQISNDDVFESFMNSYAHVYDPHSNYMSPRSSDEYNIAMKLSYVGIGATLQLIDDQVTIMNTIAGGPAAVSGLVKANDRITAVGQGKTGDMVDVIGWRLDDVVQLIRGPAGSVVRLSILPAGASPGAKETPIQFVRNKVTLEAQAAQRKPIQIVKRGDREYRIGVIDVPSFYMDFDAKVAGEKDYRSTTRDVSRLIAELKKENIDGLVMDLRGNGGGHLSEATGLVGLFIPQGPVVQLRETGGRIEVLNDPEPGAVWDGPLAVLVDRSSASASEIFSAAIQDYGRGLIVGQQTYGKGTVQNLYPLDRWALGPNAGFGELTVTIGKYYRITGDSVQNRGVMPEVVLPSLISTEEVGESTKDSALPWDRIKSVDFQTSHTLSDLVLPLNHAHEQRLNNNPDLKELAEDAAAYAQIRGQKTVSLRLTTREHERELQDSERLARINTRRAAHQQPALASLEELKPDEEPDANLAETAEIVVDLRDAQLARNNAQRATTARR